MNFDPDDTAGPRRAATRTHIARPVDYACPTCEQLGSEPCRFNGGRSHAARRALAVQRG